MWFLNAIAPGTYEWALASHIDRNHLRDTPADPTQGNVLEPMAEYTGKVGGWRQPSRIAWGQVAAVCLAGLAAAGTAWLWRDSHSVGAIRDRLIGRNGEFRLAPHRTPTQRTWRRRLAS